MNALHKDSSFKIQTGVVKTTVGLFPKPGAIVFCSTRNIYMAADGFQWLPLGQLANETAALATAVLTPLVQSRVAGVPELAQWYDTIIYILHNDVYGFTPSLGNQVAINADMNVVWTTDYSISSDKAVKLTLRSYLDDTLINTRVVNLDKAGEQFPITGFGSFPAAAGSIITLTSETDKNCTITTHFANVGLREQF